MRVIARIRRLDPESQLPVEPAEADEVEGAAATYSEARSQAASKIPEGWQVVGWVVPDHLPD